MTYTATHSIRTHTGMTPNEIKNQIRQITENSERQIEALKKQLVMLESGYKEGDVLQSTLDRAKSFRVAGSTAKGVTGTLLQQGWVITIDDLKHWRIVDQGTANR